jgi:O-antigen ligase
LKDDRFPRLQGVLGFTVLAMLLLSALALGANRPIAWSLLSIGVLVIFSSQVTLSVFLPVPLAVRKLLVPGILFLAAIGWGWVQTMGGVTEAYSHPLWSNVPEASASISADPGQGRHAVMRLLCYGMIFVTMVWTCTSETRAKGVLILIAVFSTVLAAYGLYASSVGENFSLRNFATSGRVTATFVNPNSYATYAIFGVLANLAAYLEVAVGQRDGVRGRLNDFFSGAWVFALGALICIGAVSLTQSRAGAAAGLVGLAVFLVAWRGKRQRWDPVMLLITAAVLIFVAMTSATGLTERLLVASTEDGRFAIYPAILQAIGDRPFLGHGLGSFQEVFRLYVPQEVASLEWLRAHSTYLELAFGLGLPATAAFFLAISMIVWRIYQGSLARKNGRAFSCFALGCVATAGFHSVFDFSLQMPATAALFAAILGLGFAQSFTQRAIKTAKPNRRHSRSG